MPPNKGFSRKQAAADWTQGKGGWTEMIVHGEAYAKASDKVQALANNCNALRESLDAFIEQLLPPIATPPALVKAIAALRRAEQLAPGQVRDEAVAKALAKSWPVSKRYSSNSWKQVVREVFAELLRLCVTPSVNGNATALRQLADCLEAHHRSNAHQYVDPIGFALYVAWTNQNGGGTPKADGSNLLRCTRSELLRWIRRCFADKGLGECDDERLRRALKDYGFRCLPAKKGGARKGSGRKSVFKASID